MAGRGSDGGCPAALVRRQRAALSRSVEGLARAAWLALAVLLLLPPSALSEDPGVSWAGLTIHAAPRQLHPDARTEDWPRFLGPEHDATCRETHLDLEWGPAGPPLLWECRKGEGYAAPTIAGGRLLLFHRPDENETLDCLDPGTGKHFWRFSYPVEYRDTYGYSSGPRASPVIDGNRIYTMGVTSMLHCIDAATGEVVWKRDLAAEYQVPQNFFGAGPSPFLWGDLLLQNIGGREAERGACVGAFDKMTGEERWILRHRWGSSYSSPLVARVRDRDLLLVLAGGKSRPAHGGLLLIDPSDGTLLDELSWRADKYESVNASSPVMATDDRVFISETYEKGGVLLEITEQWKLREVWRAPAFGMHWMTPVVAADHLYGFAGRNEPDAFLACYEIISGREVWRDDREWKVVLPGPRGRTQNLSWGFYRGSLLKIGEEGKRALVLGEMGDLALLELRPSGPSLDRSVSLFRAQQTWSLPVISHGLLYVAQNERSLATGDLPRILCYDLRAVDGPISAR